MKPHTEPHASSLLVERQMLLSQVRSKAASPQISGESPGGCRFITIARSVGALGDELAAELAARLNWRVYDREIVDEIAHDSHVRQDLVRELDERAQGLIHDTVARLLLMAEGISFGNEEYHEALLKTLALLATRGDAVIVGRGGAYVLQGQNGVHLRIVGSSDVRVHRLVQSWNIPTDAARRRMEQIDAERRGFIQRHFRHDIDDLSYYSAVFNTDRQSVAQVADAVVSMIKPTGSHPNRIAAGIPDKDKVGLTHAANHGTLF